MNALRKRKSTHEAEGKRGMEKKKNKRTRKYQKCQRESKLRRKITKIEKRKKK